MLLLNLFFSFFLYAQHQELIIHQDVKVYKSKSAKSEVLTTLEAGARVPLSTRNYGKWAKIKVRVAGKPYHGWLQKRDLKGSKIRKLDIEEVAGRQMPYHRRKAFGLLTSFSYASIGEQDYVDTSAQQIFIKETTGSNFYLGLFFDYPIANNKQIHSYFSMREHDVSGKATVGTGTIKNDIDVKQSYTALGFSLKNYKSISSKYWWSYGLEVARNTKMLISISGFASEIPSDELGIHILPHIGMGYDYNLTKNLYILPNAKINLLLSDGDLSYVFDLQAMLSYSF